MHLDGVTNYYKQQQEVTLKTEMMTINEAAAEFCIAPTTIRYWIKFKGLESEKVEMDFVPKTTLVRRSDIEEIMRKRAMVRK